MNALAVVLTALQTAIANPLPAPNIPFSVGEKFDYTAKMGMLKLGSATIEVVSIDTVRGVPAWYFKFGLAGGMAVFKINSTLESWTSLEDFHSLRFRRDSKENSKRYFREYEIFPDSGYYRQRQAAATTPTTAEPLDDASLLYFIRIIPLAVGQSYKLARHFMPEVNPIVVNVLERETVTTIYYRRKTLQKVTATPPGFKMIAGDATAKAPQGRRVTFWNCGAQVNVPPSSTPPACPDARGSMLRLHVTFAACWNGVSLDSPNHRQHVSYPMNGRCPAGYDVEIPQISLIYRYPLTGQHSFELASGGVYSAHADFFNGWNQGELERLTQVCLNALRHCGNRQVR